MDLEHLFIYLFLVYSWHKQRKYSVLHENSNYEHAILIEVLSLHKTVKLKYVQWTFGSMKPQYNEYIDVMDQTKFLLPLKKKFVYDQESSIQEVTTIKSIVF